VSFFVSCLNLLILRIDTGEVNKNDGDGDKNKLDKSLVSWLPDRHYVERRTLEVTFIIYSLSFSRSVSSNSRRGVSISLSLYAQ
jgi:hypothetical protein